MPEQSLVIILLGLVVGATSAITGTGGAIFATPILMLGLNMTLHQAAPITLLALMCAASVGAIQGLSAGVVRYKTALLVAAFGMAFAPTGVWLAKQIPVSLLNLLFTAILFFVAWRMWITSTQTAPIDENKPAPACMLNPANSSVFWTAACTKTLVLTGVVTGFLSGLLGIGGGFVIVPSLRKVSNFNMQTITATSLAVIALVSASSVSVYLLHGDMQWPIALPFVVSAMLSMLTIRVFSKKIPANISQRLLSILAMIAAFLMLVKVLSA